MWVRWLTVQIPGFDLVEVQLLNELVSLRSPYFAMKIIPHELLVRWMEPEPHWNRCIAVAVHFRSRSDLLSPLHTA